MNVLGVSAAYDAAGDGWRTKLAFDHRGAGWRYRWIVRRQLRYGYPTDLDWAVLRAEWRRADVTHVALGFVDEAAFGVARKPTVIHHHGTAFRLHRDRLLAEQHARHALGLVSTLDLYLLAPDDVEWSPTPYDLDWLASMRAPVDDGILRIAHAPTDRAIKSTDAFLAAVERLGHELRVEVILVEGTTWTTCLERKATADIYFDQVRLGYGVNAVEAWGMGIPVVAGAADDTLEEIERRAGVVPFVVADEATIYEALVALAEPAARARWATIGADFARRFHAEEVAVPRLQAVFERAAA